MKLEHDDTGLLYDPDARAAMRRLAGDDTLTFEAAAAVRTAFQSIERMRAHGSEGRGLSSGAMDLLLRLSDADDGGVSIGEPAQSAGVSPRNAMAAIFRGFSPEELASLRHLCLRLAGNQQRPAEHLAAQEAR